MIDLDEYIKIVGSVILVNVPSLEFFRPDDLLEWWSKSMKTALPDGVTSLTGEQCGEVGDLALRRLRSSMMLRRSS
jgi:hypothetical protein